MWKIIKEYFQSGIEANKHVIKASKSMIEANTVAQSVLGFQYAMLNYEKEKRDILLELDLQKAKSKINTLENEQIVKALENIKAIDS